MEMSFWQKTDAVRQAAMMAFPNAEYLWIDETYDDSAVICACPKPTAMVESPDSEYYRVSYAIGEDGTATLGTPERVKREVVYVTFADGAKYRSEAHEDGTVTVFEVPVFKACEDEGFPFDVPWIDRAITWFRELRDRRNWLPKIVVGHQAPGQERPANGFLDNLKRVGDTIVADLVRMPVALFQEWKSGKWPDRSIEAYPAKAQINALALLGESPPYHKELGQVRGFADGELRRIPWGGRPATPERAKEVTVGEKIEKPQETPAATVDVARFSELEERNRRNEDRLRQADVRDFRQTCKDRGLSPAILDAPEFAAFCERFSRDETVVRFAEPKDGKPADEASGLGALDRVVALFAEQAKKGAVLVPAAGELAAQPVEHPADGPSKEDVARFGEGAEGLDDYAAANKLAAEKKIPFDAAYREVVNAKKAK